MTNPQNADGGTCDSNSYAEHADVRNSVLLHCALNTSCNLQERVRGSVQHCRHSGDAD
jgi:hypothetical protein